MLGLCVRGWRRQLGQEMPSLGSDPTVLSWGRKQCGQKPAEAESLIHKVRGKLQSERDNRHRVLILPLLMAIRQSL